VDLILLRHARPEGIEGLCYGRSNLPPGAGTAALATRLAGELPPPARILTSPLARAARLAEAIAAARGLVAEPDPRLAEMDFGAWEGQLWNAIPRAQIDAWAADLLHARPHGGESVAMLAARVATALAAAEAGPRPVLAVTHAGPIRAALARAGQHDAWRAQIGFGAWLALPRPGSAGR